MKSNLYCNWRIIGFKLLFCALLALFSGLSTASAQNFIGKQAAGKEASSTDSGYDGFLDQARKDGSTIIVIKPPAANQAVPAQPPFSSSSLLEIRNRIPSMVRNASQALNEFPDVLRKTGPDGTLNWLMLALATAIGGLVAGQIAYRTSTRWIRHYLEAFYDPAEKKRSRILGYLLSRALLTLVGTAILFAVAFLVAIVFDSRLEPARQTIFLILVTYAGYRVLRYVIFFNFFAPDTPAHRLISLSNDAARRLYRDWSVVLIASSMIVGICRWVGKISPSDDLYRLSLIAGLLVGAGMIAIVAIIHREDIRAIVYGKNTRAKVAVWRRIAGVVTLPIILVYLLLAWVVSSYRLSMGLEGGYDLVGAPIIVFVPSVFVYGISIFLLELIYERREYAFHRRQKLQELRNRRIARANRKSALAGNTENDILLEHEEMTVHQPSLEEPGPPYTQPIFKRFFELGILSAILVVAGRVMSRMWGLDLSREGGHPLSSALDIFLVSFLALVFYRAVNDYIDSKILEEGGTLDGAMPAPGESDNEGGVGQSRLATLLPIIRNVIVATLTVIAGMIVLANLGVNVGPIFAGAGVIGLAIGFGAQTLIRDIFSGAFFLLDDAFRKGEYIEIGTVKGVVEKISVRSFQLRHHLGAIHTVPFGEIKQLTNYSRDWVMMKLPLRVTYDTDVDKVRKLIKKVGQELQQDPAVGSLFVQPLKSQGVFAMEDSAMIIRVKFMTRPGDQFVTRKAVYAAIREAFAANDIKFAHREVTVRLADGEKADDLTVEQKEAAGGAVRSIVGEP